MLAKWREADPSIARLAVIAALGLAVVAVAVILLVTRGGYSVRARFENASQIVKGNLVEVAGQPVGKVARVSLTDDGQAQLTLRIDGGHAPLHEGTRAVIRATSLSGVANRYVDLQLGPGTAAPIRDGGIIPATQTTSAVDLDEIFNVFGPRERRALSQVIRQSGGQYARRGPALSRGFQYLNPALVASRRLFAEVNRDPAALRSFIGRSAHLVTDIAAKRADVASLVDHLAAVTGAVARQRAGLAEAVQRLPGFMRRANTTFVDLRSTLDDLRPLVDESKPVAVKLRPFLAQLQPLTADARPTLRQLNQLLRRRGVANDLVELTRSAVPVGEIALGPVEGNGAQREGAFPAASKALAGATPELGFARPYVPELTSWFDDFSHSGPYDALGGIARVALHANLFTLSGGLPTGTIIPPEDRAAAFLHTASLGQNDRCPGAAERDPGDHSTPYKPSPDFACDPAEVPLGP